MTIHLVYGLTFTSDFELTAPLPRVSSVAELAVRLHPPGFGPSTARRGQALYRSPLLTAEAESVSELYEVERYPLLCCTGIGEFHLTPGRIDIYPQPNVSDRWIEIRLLGMVLPFLLESRGSPTLHAATIVYHNQAVALLSASGGGKTSLGAATLTAGASLLADDLLALQPDEVGHWLGLPGYPQMRMWPDLAEHYLPEAARNLDRVLTGLDKRRVPVGPPGLGRFCSRPAPLTAIYLVERQDDAQEVQITPQGPAESLMQLVRHSFTPYVVEALGWQARRLETFGRLLESVPVKSLRYPSGLDRLPEVVDRLFSDLEA